MINFASNLNKMIDAGLGGPLDPPRTEVAVGHRIVFTEASGAVVNFETNMIAPMKNLRVTMEPIQEGSGDPSPDNIRPITGRESVTVTRAGVNVWDEEWEKGLINKQGVPVDNEYYIRSKNYISILPSTTYFYLCPTYYSDYGRFAYYDADKQFISYIGTSVVVNKAFTTPENARFMKFCTGDKVGMSVTYNHDISINYPATDTAYHPGNVESATIQFGQTVYEGKLDAVNGVMTVDKSAVDMGELSWVLDTLGRFVAVVSDIEQVTSTAFVAVGIMCSIFAPSKSPIIDKSTDNTIARYADKIYVVASAYTDAASFKAAVTGQTLVYELAEPFTVQLTPEQLTTVKGDNNVWSDAGNISLEYLYYEEMEGY